MDVKELAQLVVTMRNAQRDYFVHRRAGTFAKKLVDQLLKNAKATEQNVDRAVLDILSPGLFDNQD